MGMYEFMWELNPSGLSSLNVSEYDYKLLPKKLHSCTANISATFINKP
jgi:hypothetical protein